jgi:hypothetical protein
MLEIQTESDHLAREGESAERAAEQAALSGDKGRQGNAEALMIATARKMKALNREAEAILAEARRERAP